MAAISPSIVSSAIFGVRNYEKGNDGHIVRYAVAAGQAKKVVDYVSQFDNAVGQTAKTATMALGAASKESIFLDKCAKVASFSSTHINPLIVASACVDVMQSDNKAETAIVSATSLGTMFTVEKQMKKHLHKVPKLKCFSKITEAVTNATKGTKYGKFLGPVLEGIAFVIGSCVAYDAGNKFGNLLIGKQ